MPHKIFKLLPLVLLSLSYATSCDRAEPRADKVTVRIGDTSWQAELATTPKQRYRGLSGRHYIAADEAMLFVFPEPRSVTFCMRDCEVPIDVAFFDADRRLINIHTMAVEADRKGSVPYPSARPARYALEVASGALEAAGVQPGDRIEFLDPLPPAR